jgi:hypothetical protein
MHGHSKTKSHQYFVFTLIHSFIVCSKSKNEEKKNIKQKNDERKEEERKDQRLT